MLNPGDFKSDLTKGGDVARQLWAAQFGCVCVQKLEAESRPGNALKVISKHIKGPKKFAYPASGHKHFIW